MATVIPFTGLRFNIEKVADLSKTVSPPYDLISPELQDDLYGRDSHNIVRIDFGKALASDDEYENQYSRAAAMTRQWRQDGWLAADDRRTFTAYEQTYTLPDGTTRTRRGVFVALRLEDPESGRVRPHERTFRGPKNDRFRLMRATQCNTSSVFCVYSDPRRIIDAVLAEEAKKKPWSEFLDENGIHHRAWIVSSDRACKQIQDALIDKELFIADGHHRYETALLYRDHMRDHSKASDDIQPYDFTLAFLANLDDEGTAILPIHRALAPEMDDGVNPEEFFAELEHAFDIEQFGIDLDRAGAGYELMEKLAQAGRKRAAIAVALNGGRAAILALKPGLKRRDLFTRALHKSIRELDVTLLHEVVIRQAWVGNPEINLGDQDIFYQSDAEKAIDMLRRRKACAVFLLNPTTEEQMMTVARAGRRMPQKSTFFYPKVITGIVMRDLQQL